MPGLSLRAKLYQAFKPTEVTKYLLVSRSLAKIASRQAVTPSLHFIEIAAMSASLKIVPAK